MAVTLFCTPGCSADQLNFFAIVLWQYHHKGSSKPITWLHNCIMTFAIIVLTLSCCDITCKSILALGFFFVVVVVVGARGEPGNKDNVA